MKKEITLITLLFTFFISACTFKTSYIQSDSREYTPTNASIVKIYSGYPEDLKYDIIGSVSVNGLSKESAVKAVKEKVAKMGGDALVGTKLDVISTYHDRVGISGVAVRIKK